MTAVSQPDASCGHYKSLGKTLAALQMWPSYWAGPIVQTPVPMTLISRQPAERRMVVWLTLSMLTSSTRVSPWMYACVRIHARPGMRGTSEATLDLSSSDLAAEEAAKETASESML